MSAVTEPSSTEQTQQPRPGSPKRSIWNSPWLWAAVAGLIFIPLMRPLLIREPAPPPVIGQLPAFSLTDSSGAPFGSDDLAGQVWVADLIFTRCTSICPLLTAAMRRLDQRYLEEGVEGIRLVSFSVDPEYDTPEVLREYSESFGIDPARWSFLTGPPERVRELVVEGFRTGLGPRTENADLIEIAHSAKFVLIDWKGRIRGYYDVDMEGLDEVFHRSRHVVKQQRREKGL